ncbi:shikimate kinase [Verrucomicrobia bacterium S94]|nr:shikimate kinase [Verrucomicrobia bacterium S94]
MEKTNLVLIGMPASGKSTLGVQLAKWLSKGFIDTDLLVQARAGESMQAFQDRDGLAEYQELECATVQSVVCENCVISTGGSAVYCDSAMAHLKSMATVIFLDVPLDEIIRRIGDFSKRGVVIKPGMTLADLYEERRPLYLKYADHVMACSGKSQDELLQEIRALV